MSRCRLQASVYNPPFTRTQGPTRACDGADCCGAYGLGAGISSEATGRLSVATLGFCLKTSALFVSVDQAKGCVRTGRKSNYAYTRVAIKWKSKNPTAIATSILLRRLRNERGTSTCQFP